MDGINLYHIMIKQYKHANKLFQSKYHDYISNDMSNKMYECLIYEAEKLQYKIDNLLEKSHK